MSTEYQIAVTARSKAEKSEKLPAASAAHCFESVISTQSRLSRQQAADAAKVNTEITVIAR
jgi:hypothetical protein